MYFGQGHVTATVDLELTSLMLQFRAGLERLARGESDMAADVLERVKSQLHAAKAFLDGVRSGDSPDGAGAEMFSLLIVIENPSDWDAFHERLDQRLSQIDSLRDGVHHVEELKTWADNILEALQERGRGEATKGHTWWSL